MSFLGKKFRRVRCENIDELVRVSNANENVIQMLKCNAPTFSFTRHGDQLMLTLQMEDKLLTHTFKLSEEHEMERRNGSKVKLMYTLENDNVLKQVIKLPDGKVVHFRREFGQNDAKMIITMEGTDAQATVYYEVVS